MAFQLVTPLTGPWERKLARCSGTLSGSYAATLGAGCLPLQATLDRNSCVRRAWRRVHAAEASPGARWYKAGGASVVANSVPHLGSPQRRPETRSSRPDRNENRDKLVGTLRSRCIDASLLDRRPEASRCRAQRRRTTS